MSSTEGKVGSDGSGGDGGGQWQCVLTRDESFEKECGIHMGV